MKGIILTASAILFLSGKVPDNGFYLVNGKIIKQENSELIVTVKNNKVTVKAK